MTRWRCYCGRLLIAIATLVGILFRGGEHISPRVPHSPRFKCYLAIFLGIVICFVVFLGIRVKCLVSSIEFGEQLLAACYPVKAFASLTELGEAPQIHHVCDGEHAAEVLDYGMCIWLTPIARFPLQWLDPGQIIGAHFSGKAAAKTVCLLDYNWLSLLQVLLNLLAAEIGLLDRLIVSDAQYLSRIVDI